MGKGGLRIIISTLSFPKQSRRENAAARILPLFSRPDLPRRPHSWKKSCWRNYPPPNQHFFQKVDLISLPSPSHQDKNDRKWILQLWEIHQNCSFLTYFTIDLVTFNEKQLFHFEASVCCLQRILCFDIRHRLFFLYHENKPGQNPISNVSFLCKCKTRKNPDPSRQTRNALLRRKFSISAQVHGMKVKNIKSIL